MNYTTRRLSLIRMQCFIHGKDKPPASKAQQQQASGAVGVAARLVMNHQAMSEPSTHTTPPANTNDSGGTLPYLMTLLSGGGGTTNVIESPAPVPDVLLSLAKDDRYISQLADMISQVVVPFASMFVTSQRNNNTTARSSTTPTESQDDAFNDDELIEDDGQRFIERIRPELNLLASIIVHSATFVFYTRQFREDGGESNSTTEGVKQRSIGMESLNLAYEYPRKQQGSSVSMQQSKDIKIRHARDYLVKLMQIARGLILPRHISRWHSLLFLQTIVPYIIQRVGRGGWGKDLGGMSTDLLHVFGMSSMQSPAMTRTSNNQGEEDADVRNDDRLRGAARRRLFEAQRRSMMRSARNIAENGAVDGESSAHDTDTDASEVQRSGTDVTRRNRSVSRLSSLSWNTLQRASLAVTSLNHGAHTLRSRAPTVNGNYDRYTKILKWFIRLHLALFYWNGSYPTIAHRLVGARIRDSVTPSSPGATLTPNAGSIVANRPSYKPIAALIFVQALTALAQSTAEASIEAAHLMQVAFFRWRRRRRMTQQFHHNTGGRGSLLEQQTYNNSNMERDEYLELIEERVPGITSSNQNDVPNATKRNQSKHSGQDSHSCGICLNQRVHPAAPSVCGHVFCWNCILHWVANVRAECPLCRAKTRPQDVIPLYNYP
eukprot:g818.t1 g818   contig10:792388-794453(+)